MIGKNLVIIEGIMVGSVKEEPTGTGVTITSILVAVAGNRWDNKSKQETPSVDEIPVSLFGKSAIYAKENAKDGDLILLSGKLSSRKSSNATDTRRFINLFVTDFSIVKVAHRSAPAAGSAPAPAAAPAPAPQEDLPF